MRTLSIITRYDSHDVAIMAVAEICFVASATEPRPKTWLASSSARLCSSSALLKLLLFRCATVIQDASWATGLHLGVPAASSKILEASVYSSMISA